MSRPESRSARSRLTPATAVVSAMIGAVALAGCGAGQITQTSDQVAAVGGGNATAGAIAVRNAQIEFDTAAEGAAIYRAGESAPLEATVVNTGGVADRLVAASSPVASSVEISGVAEVPGGQVLVVEGVPVQAFVPSEAGTAGATEPGAPTPGVPVPPAPTTAPEAPAPEAPAPEPTSAAPAPEATASPDGPRTASVVLTGLREDLRSGPSYPVVLTFERAGEVRVDVPIGNPDTPRQDQH